MTKVQAVKIFNEEIKKHIPKHDKVAIRTAWNDWTDSLCKDGEITERQYNNWLNPIK